jgi:cell division protein FtsW (lipid II flippase)
MRVVAAEPNLQSSAVWQRGAPRAINVELVGLGACSLVVLLGLFLTYWGRTARLQADGPEPASIVSLRQLSSPAALEPALTMYEQLVERQAIARALFERATSADAPIEHVGALASVTIPAADVRKDARLVVLNARLARRPEALQVPALSAADLAAIKPRLAVRTQETYGTRMRTAALWFFAAFWIAHLVRRWRRVDDEPLILPTLLLLCGIGLMSMIALRDPIRDMVIATPFVVGVVMGLAVLLVASEIDFEASSLRRAVLPPLCAAFALAVALLVFGRGPGTSGAKVNLLGVQPVEAIRLLVILALAAYFSRRLDLLRELSERAGAPRTWLHRIRMPRWKDVRPIVASMGIVLLFFFLQKDLGPALVMSCVFLALYGIARGRAVFVAMGFGMLATGFAAAYVIGTPATVRQRVMIWLDPWNNGVAGGNQIAHGLWALSTGGSWGLGQGLGAPQVIPAGHTDFVLAAVGEELGFVGLAVVVALYAFLSWRCIRVAMRAPGDYTAFLATGMVLALAVQALIIASGILGLVPLSGVVTPFLSYGKSSMLANFAAIGTVLAIARRKTRVRAHLQRPIRILATVFALLTAVVVARAFWVQVPRADEYAAHSGLGGQADGGYRFEYNPRLLSVARQIPRGSIYDRNGLPLATSRQDEIHSIPGLYRKAGIALPENCDDDAPRCYPLGGIGFHLIGDWRYQTNWGARNSSYLERDRAATLQGFDDHPEVVDIVNPETSAKDRIVQRSYRELLAMARSRYRSGSGPVKAVLARDRNILSSIDAGLQVRASAALRRRIETNGNSRGSAVVLDADTGEVLAAASYPWPAEADVKRGPAGGAASEHVERFFDRTRYGWYPPGSVFKLVVAGAALRSDTSRAFACTRLPDGRVGNYVSGSKRPVRDDPLDTRPHGDVELREAIVVSCNAYFAQLAQKLGPRPILDASALFQIDAARVPTPSGLEGSLAHAGYGQGEVLVSPLKMARVAASIASGGVVRPVRWERKPTGTDQERRFLSASDAMLLSRHMRDVVGAGTGRVLQGNRTPIAGKTGTAEIGTGRAHSWFVGFAPYGGSSRRIAFAVIVENAGYGANTAAPIAGEIVNAARELGVVR